MLKLGNLEFVDFGDSGEIESLLEQKIRVDGDNTKQCRMFYRLFDYANKLERNFIDFYVMIVPTESGGLILELCDSSDDSCLDDTYVTSYRVGKQVLKDWFITK